MIEEWKGRKGHSSFKDSIWAEDLAEMGQLFPFYDSLKYLLAVINGFSKYVWVKL